MSDYKRAKTAVSVPYGDARHVAEPAGAVIRVADVAPFLQRQFAEGDRWVATLFEDASQRDHEIYKGFVTKLKEEATKVEEVVDAVEGEVKAEVEPVADPIKAQRRRSRKVQKEETEA